MKGSLSRGHLHPGSHAIVRNNILGDVSDGTEGVLHEVGREIDVALHHGGDFIDDRHACFLDQLLRQRIKIMENKAPRKKTPSSINKQKKHTNIQK